MPPVIAADAGRLVEQEVTRPEPVTIAANCWDSRSLHSASRRLPPD
jgi:hypothetical protein